MFEFKNGRWNEAETDTSRRSIQNRHRVREQDDVAEQLKQLAATPLDVFHWRSVTDPEPVSYDPRYSQDIRDEHNEGDIVLYNDGTAVLGSECFPADVGIKAYRFGGSVAYRERGCSMLVVASPGSIRFYYAKCADGVQGWNHNLTLGVPGFRVARFREARQERAECRGPFRGLKRLLLLIDGVEQREGKFKTSTYSNQTLYSPGCPGLVYLSSERTVYVRIWEQEIEKFGATHPELHLEYLTEPKRQKLETYYYGQVTSIATPRTIHLYESHYDIPEPFIAIPSGVTFTYKSPNLTIDAWSDTLILKYDNNYLTDYFDTSSDTPSAFCGLQPNSYLITRGEATYSFATWGDPSTCSWDWYKLTPRQGAVELPQLGGQPLKRLGR